MKTDIGGDDDSGDDNDDEGDDADANDDKVDDDPKMMLVGVATMVLDGDNDVNDGNKNVKVATCD